MGLEGGMNTDAATYLHKILLEALPCRKNPHLPFTFKLATFTA